MLLHPENGLLAIVCSGFLEINHKAIKTTPIINNIGPIY
jgi:hypothetical protein